MKPDELNLKIITTSDVHGAIFPYDLIEDTPMNSSLAQVYTYVKEQRENKQQEVILLDNGDFLQGQPIVYYANYIKKTEQHVCADIMNFMGYEAASVGNHDIETGHEIYDKLRKEFNFPWLAANAIKAQTGEPYFEPYTIINKQGFKIAIIGLITPSVPTWLPQKIWAGIEFEDMIESAEKWVNIVKEKENPDVIIGLFHSGVDYTYNNQKAETYKNENASRLVAEKVRGFDVIFAGHDHREHNKIIKNPDGENVWILDPKNSARFVAVAGFYLKKDESGKLIEKKITGMTIEMDHCEADYQFIERYASYLAEVKSYVSKPIAKFNRSISSRDAMFGNTAFVDIIHIVQLDLTGADVSFASPLSYDSKIVRGTIKIRDMFKLYKFENLLYVMELTGKEIKDYLEYSYSGWFNTMQNRRDHLLRFVIDIKGFERLHGKFYNYSSASGIDYIVDLTKPEGDKIEILQMSNGEAFDYIKTYKVAVNSYRGNGGGGHLTEGAKIPHNELVNRIISSTKKDLRHILKDWFEKEKIINPKALGNWKAVPEFFWKNGRRRDYQQLYDN